MYVCTAQGQKVRMAPQLLEALVSQKGTSPTSFGTVEAKGFSVRVVHDLMPKLDRHCLVFPLQRIQGKSKRGRCVDN